ncbi:MAG: DUF389 domain-containing protein, partial [Kofleriaceae bacterium]
MELAARPTRMPVTVRITPIENALNTNHIRSSASGASGKARPLSPGVVGRDVHLSLPRRAAGRTPPRAAPVISRRAMSSFAKLTVRLQDRLARHLGLEPDKRPIAVRAMLLPRVGEGVGYWLQLMMAAALATLGLALDSTAVGIGAMLIAPLMRPIVELAMGLATGSAALTFRAGIRSIVSVIAVVGAATAISWLLPFHEITKELTARTAPSLIDLFVAAACALAGAYATMFSSSEMASTAAGTSIGISLVPPLCTLGYAVSVGQWQMATGAALLFTANITGIITVAGVVFLLVGFGQVDIHAAEVASEINLAGVTGRLGTNWSKASTRLGAISRLVLPLLLLAAIFVPLRRAVGEMARRSALRQDIGTLLAHTPLRVAQSSIQLDAAGAIVRVVIVGDALAASELDGELRSILVRRGEATPRLSVWAVPDAKALGALANRIDDLPPPAVAAPPPRDISERSPAEVSELVTKTWPSRGTGTPVATWLQAGSPPQLHVVHLGPALGEAGRELLAATLSPSRSVVLIEESLDPIEAPVADGLSWAAQAFAMAERARARTGVVVCVVVPAPPQPPAVPRPRAPVIAEAAEVVTLRTLVERAFAAQPGVMITRGDRWSLTPTLGTCPTTAPSG